MSTTEYIPSITNRTFHNVEQAKKNPNSIDLEATNGAWNFTDMNRVINNLKYAAECMRENLYFIEAYELVSKTDWNEEDIITQEQLRNMVSDHMANLRSYITDNTLVPNWTHITSILNMDYNFANSLEKNIDLLSEALPSINKMKLTVINGSGSGEYRVGEVVSIESYEPYCHFKSEYVNQGRIYELYDEGEAFDYIVPYSETGEITIEWTRKNKINILTVETHDGSETYEVEVGETITIDAHMTTTDKNFVCWHINDEADDHLRYLFENQNAETTVFTMPDKDMTISAEYCDPCTPALLRVHNGLGTGWYYPGKYFGNTNVVLPIRSTLSNHNRWVVNSAGRSQG